MKKRCSLSPDYLILCEKFSLKHKEKKKQRIREAKIKKTTEHQNVSSESGGLGWEILDVLARK